MDEQLLHTYEQLSDQKKMILHYSIFHQLKNKEIASLLNCSPQNVSKIKRQAIDSLRSGYTDG
ncbi:hypothetical protein LF817_19230 [Halobacillus sp. A1]|uniref:RNA polymerase sigma factor n=1 Tax=Halobacillus sp. A1 TaxID=2880262 RepID=UPI003531EE62|nr:hypothetical protein [Halobacillus sp. A1]